MIIRLTLAVLSHIAHCIIADPSLSIPIIDLAVTWVVVVVRAAGSVAAAGTAVVAVVAVAVFGVVGVALVDGVVGVVAVAWHILFCGGRVACEGLGVVGG